MGLWIDLPAASWTLWTTAISLFLWTSLLSYFLRLVASTQPVFGWSLCFPFWTTVLSSDWPSVNWKWSRQTHSCPFTHVLDSSRLSEPDKTSLVELPQTGAWVQKENPTVSLAHKHTHTGHSQMVQLYIICSLCLRIKAISCHWQESWCGMFLFHDVESVNHIPGPWISLHTAEH